MDYNELKSYVETAAAKFPFSDFEELLPNFHSNRSAFLIPRFRAIDVPSDLQCHSRRIISCHSGETEGTLRLCGICGL